MLAEGWEKMELSEPGKQKVETQNFWQYVKHVKLYSDLLQAQEGE